VISLFMSFREIKNLFPLKEHIDKNSIFQTLLKGQALYYFEHHLRRRLESEYTELPDHELIELVLRDLGLESTPKRAICMKKIMWRRFK
jgi:hypothetical protein